MSFADIALKNVRNKFGSYLVYFFSTVFSVVIFDLFCTMYYNPAFEAYRFGTGKMTTLFRGSAIAVLLFASVFVLYSGSYFVKTQKKEMAIYSLLGMRKGQIALMMFFETFIIGLLAVALGSLIGTVSAGYFTSLLMRFMAMGTKVTLTVEPRAILATVAAFTVLFIISGFKAYLTIYKYSLIDLLSAAKLSEGVPGYSLWGAGASLLLLGAGYFIAGRMDLNAGGMKLLLPAFIVIVLVSLGTFLLFRNFIPMAVVMLKKRRRLYYRTSNFISLSQIAFRLKANSKMLSVAALLCAVTITMISASYSLYHGLEDAVDMYAPYSYLAKDISESRRKEILQSVADTGEVTVTADDTIVLCNVLIQNDSYGLLGEGGYQVAVGGEAEAYLLSESGYLDIIRHTEAQLGEYASIKTSFSGGLADGECYFIDGNMVNDHCKMLLGQPLTVTMNGAEAQYTVTGAGLHKYLGLADLYLHPTVVVSDGVFESWKEKAGPEGITTFLGLMFDDEMGSASTVDAINKLVAPRFGKGGMPDNISYIGMYRANFALYGSYVFIGLFIGILFMLAVGSVLYYKLIIEAQEEAPRYEILRKTGLSKGELRASVAKQLGLVYGIPLSLGLVHTIFALFTYNRMMAELGQETPTLQNALMITFIFVIVYGIFYGLSVRGYHRILWKRAGGVN